MTIRNRAEAIARMPERHKTPIERVRKRVVVRHHLKAGDVEADLGEERDAMVGHGLVLTIGAVGSVARSVLTRAMVDELLVVDLGEILRLARLQRQILARLGCVHVLAVDRHGFVLNEQIVIAVRVDSEQIAQL